MFKKLVLVTLIFMSFLITPVFESKAGIYEDTFSYYEVNSTSHYLYSQYSFPIPETFTSFLMYIPKTSLYEASANIGGVVFRSYMTFYNDSGFIVGYFYFDNVDFVDEVNNSTTGVYLNLETIITELSLPSATAFNISFIQSYADRPLDGYLDWFNDRFTLAFDIEDLETLGINTGSYNMVYKVDNEPYYTLGYSSIGIPDKPLDPVKENEIFRGWKTDENVIYDFLSPLPFTPITRTMTAMFQEIYEDTSPVVIDNTPDFFGDTLTSIGFNNPIGKLFLYIIIMATITILMVHYEVGTFLNLLVNVFLYGLFIFFGWLPMYAIIILGLFFIIGFMMYIKSGGGN